MTSRHGHVRVLQKHGSTFRVTIPKDLANEMGFEGADDVWFEKHKGHLELYPVEIRPKTGAKRFGGD